MDADHAGDRHGARVVVVERHGGHAHDPDHGHLPDGGRKDRHAHGWRPQELAGAARRAPGNGPGDGEITRVGPDGEHAQGRPERAGEDQPPRRYAGPRTQVHPLERRHDEGAPHRPDRPGGQDDADRASPLRRRVHVGDRSPREVGTPEPRPEGEGAHEQAQP